MKPASAEFAQLIRQARSGDLEAFARLFDSHRHWLRLVVRAQMGTALRKKADSGDLLQDTFLTASQSVGEFRGRDPAAFVKWLEVIATRRVYDASRRYVTSEKRAANREVSLDQLMAQSRQSSDRLAAVLAASGVSPSQGAQRSEQLLALADALARLPDDYQRVVQMRFLEERSLDEIAAEFGRSKGAVTMLIARAVRQLRELLEDGDSSGAS